MIRNLIKACLFLLGTLLVAVAIGVVYFSMNPPPKSGFSNCVIVDNPRAYSGEWLKNNELKKGSRIKTEQCQLKDDEIDNGDGARKGRVRWAECSVGPDCDEAGML